MSRQGVRTTGGRRRTAATPAAAPARWRTAALSVISNSALILLKVVAGTVTGSVALLTEALHSSFDLIASVVAFVSIRKADVPADDDHPYGHQKFEDMAAAIEGMLILVGSGVVVFEAVRRLVVGGAVHSLGFGLVVLAVSIAVNLVVSGRLRERARETGSPALHADAAHLRTDALTSGGVFVGLALVQVTGADWLDPVAALAVAASIVIAGVRILRSSSRVLIDEALPAEELAAIAEEVGGFGPRGVRGDAAPCRPPRAVPGGNDARGGPRDVPRAAEGDPGPPRRRRCPHPLGARGPRRPRDRGRASCGR